MRQDTRIQDENRKEGGSSINMEGNINETVEELKAKLDAMKNLLAEEQLKQALANKRQGGNATQSTARRDSIIDGSFLSAVFGVVLVLIIGVSFYAFQNLYFAILKRFPAKHTEL